MVAGYGITNECPHLITHHVEKPPWIKLRQLTLSGNPLPIQKLPVGPPILQAILMRFNEVTAFIGVNRTQRVRHPIPTQIITFPFPCIAKKERQREKKNS